MMIWIWAFSLLSGLISAKCLNPVANCNSSVNYFPSVPKFLYSLTVTKIESTNTYINVELSYGDPKVTESYVLVQCGCPAPTEQANSKVFFVPIESGMVQDRVTVPKISLIGQTYSIPYVEDSSSISSSTFISAVKYGIVNDISFDYSQIKNTSYPDVIFSKPGTMMRDNVENPTWYNQSFTSALEALRFSETDAFEQTALGRAELLKLYGIFFGVSDSAESIFSAVEQNYLAAKSAASSLTATRASVVRGYPKDGDWQLLPKYSYLSYLLRDAGALFLDADMFTSTALPASAFKQFFGHSSVWIDIYGDMNQGSGKQNFDLFNGNESKTYGADAQYFLNFLPVQCREYYSNGAQQGYNGNALYEAGIMRPDLILWDLVQIIHKESFPIPALHFYERIDDNDQSFPKEFSGRAKCPVAKIPSSPENDYVFIDRRFSISGVYPALYANIIPSIVKPRLEELTGAKAEDLSIVIVNSEHFSETNFDVRIRIYSDLGNMTKFAYAMEDPEPMKEILADSYSSFLNSNGMRSSISFLKHVPASATVGTLGDVTVTHSDGVKSTYISGTTFSTSSIIGIVIGVILFAIFLSWLVSRIAFRKGKEYAYQKLEEEKGMENGKSIDTLVAEFENGDEEGDFVEMRPKSDNQFEELP